MKAAKSLIDQRFPKVEKISRSSAVSLLTAGVPTISMTFDGRRQVFVESRTDAYLYDMLYQRLKSKIESDRSLVFIQVGNSSNSGGEHNSGCAQVVRLVDTLSGAGNVTVFGLIDWDGDRKPTSRVHVLSPGLRDGLESLLFDPVLLVAVIVRENLSFAIERGLIDHSETYFSLAVWTSARWQRAVNIMQALLVPAADVNDTLNVSYMNGMTLAIQREYLHLDDHALETQIVENFGFLRPKNKRAGELMRFIVETVVSEIPGLTPDDLITSFQAILQSEI